MDLDEVKYTNIPGSVLMVSENDKEISNFVSRTTSYWGYAWGYFYRDRFYLLLSVENEGRSVLFRMNDYENQTSEYQILKSLVNTYIPYQKSGQMREKAMRIVEYAEQKVKQGRKFEDGAFLDPDESNNW